MASMKDGDDPKDFGVDEVNEHLEGADEAETQRVLKAESDGKARKGILEVEGREFDASKRYDGSGRELHPWETDPVKAAKAGRAVPRDAAPENQQSPDSDATPDDSTPQPATSPAGSGTAAPSGATGNTPGSDGGTTTGTTTTGADTTA